MPGASRDRGDMADGTESKRKESGNKYLQRAHCALGPVVRVSVSYPIYFSFINIIYSFTSIINIIA